MASASASIAASIYSSCETMTPRFYNIKACLGERVIEDLVPHRVYVRADDADDEYLFPFFIHSCTSPHTPLPHARCRILFR